MWPHSKISVMGGEQASMVLNTVSSGKGTELINQFETESRATYSSSRLWDDGIIEPSETRNILALCIAASLNKKFDAPKAMIYRM
jgi:3-methylcrotonyl-CoA carboxylase beta subunit